MNTTDAARALGSIRTARKAKSSRENIARANRERAVKGCACGQTPHRSRCPVYRREYGRRRRAG